MSQNLTSPYLYIERAECRSKLLPEKKNVWQDDIVHYELISDAINHWGIVANTSSQDIKIKSIELMRIPFGQHKKVRFLRFGLNMPGDSTGFYEITENGFGVISNWQEKLVMQEFNDYYRAESNSLLCLKSEDSETITLIGAITFEKSEGTVELYFDKKQHYVEVAYKQNLDGVRLKANAKMMLDRFVILKGNDLNELLKRWADLCVEQNGALIPAEIPTGWNDWQYYRNEKTAKDVLDSAEVIADLKRQSYSLDFIQIDGGFCMHLSEWSKVKPEFAPGIRELSEKIYSMGLSFGLWFAPYIQNVNTKVVKEHPEWLMQDQDGSRLVLDQSNVGQSCLIDYTVPGTEEWLREQIRLFVNDWKVKWIKLDGPNYAFYRNGQMHDDTKTISQMLNRTFEIIREEAGPDVLVEGEGVMGLALGKVDLHRVQTDNHPSWYRGNVKSKEYAPRVYGKELILSFLHNRWWCNHRENIVLRNFPSEFCHASESDRDKVEQLFTEPEFRTQLTAAVMGSGGLLLTDPMKELIRDKERFAWVSKILPVYNKAAEMVDCFPDSRYPSVYKMDIDKNTIILSFTNWSDNICDFETEIPEKDYYAFSVFESKVLGIYNGKLRISGLTAHDSRIIVLKKRSSSPQLIATDMHLLPGTVDIKSCDYNDNCLEINLCHFKQSDNHIFLAANGYKITAIKTDAKRYSLDTFEPDQPVIRFEGKPKNTNFKIIWD